MKPAITAGAYGWRHSHWSGCYYPEGLPSGELEYDADDWRLSYYSNDFDSVLVPAIYWQTATAEDCVSWLDDVPSDFEFFVECYAPVMDQPSLIQLDQVLSVLKPQLSALVVTESKAAMTGAAEKAALFDLINGLEINVYGFAAHPGSQAIWLPEEATEQTAGQAEDKTLPSSFALFSLDLKDLRQARDWVERFAAQLEADVSQASIIVNHPQLQADDLLRLRSVLALMGY